MSESQQRDDSALEAALLVKVRKLMDKAAATANPHETDAFSRKAAELIARHRLDPEHIRVTAGQGELVVREVPLGRGAYVRARLALLMAVATSQDARVVFGTTPTGTIAYLAGFATELDLVEMMYHSLHEQAATQMASIKRSTAAATQRFRRSFLFGFADRVGQLLAQTRSDAEAAASVGPSSPVAVALRERGERMDEFARRSFGRVRTARSPSAAQAGGWKAGASAADRADVGRARLAGRKALGRST